MMKWVAVEHRADQRNGAKRRAIAWTCTTDSRLMVRHCGHPTANYPYYVRIDGIDRMDLGTHRLLAEAQAAAMRAVEG